ncbi:MAG: PEP-CTERM sorting domain-containing protein [Fimbriimonas sp.]
MILCRCSLIGLLAVACPLVWGQAPPTNLSPKDPTKGSTLVSNEKTADGKAYKEISAKTFAEEMKKILFKDGKANAKDAKFIFQNCYGGGFLHTIDELIGTSIPWVGGSAANAEQVGWAGTQSGGCFSQAFHNNYGYGKTLIENLNKAREKDKAGPNGDPNWKLPDGTKISEDPQTTYKNGGENIKLDDREAKSHNAIIWGGVPDNPWVKKDVERMRNKLEAEWAGTNFTIDILMGDGSELGVLATLDNLKKKVTDIAALMNKDEQFFFYGADHGGSETFLVQKESQVVVPGGGGTKTVTLKLTEGEKDGMRLDPTNSPRLSFSLEGGPLIAPNFLFTINGIGVDFSRVGSTIGPDGSYNYDLDVDEAWLPIGKDAAGLNEIDLTFTGLSTDFTIQWMTFGTGAIAGIGAEPVPEPGSMVALGIGVLAFRRRRR